MEYWCAVRLQLGCVFFNFLIQVLLRPQIAIWLHVTILYVWKTYIWENDKILVTLAINVCFWSMGYLWHHLCKEIQDFRLSHTFAHSFSHFPTQNQNIWNNYKVITFSGFLTKYSVDALEKGWILAQTQAFYKQ